MGDFISEYDSYNNFIMDYIKLSSKYYRKSCDYIEATNITYYIIAPIILINFAFRRKILLYINMIILAIVTIIRISSDLILFVSYSTRVFHLLIIETLSVEDNFILNKLFRKNYFQFWIDFQHIEYFAFGLIVFSVICVLTYKKKV